MPYTGKKDIGILAPRRLLEGEIYTHDFQMCIRDSDSHSRLVDVDWNATYPIYDMVSDPVTKADLKLAVEKYINLSLIHICKVKKE